MKRLVGVICLMAMVTACDPGLDREELKEEVMAVHDAVMPQWSQLKKLQKRVLAKASELEMVDDANPEISKLTGIASDLDAAHEVMYTWMKDWGKNAGPYEKDGDASDEEALQFFEKEQERVDKMEKQLMEAYEAAMAVLK